MGIPSLSYSAESPVDRSQPLVHLEQEFALCDGACYDGRGNLFVPDVKGQKLYQRNERTGKWSERVSEAGRISGTFFQLGKVYLSHNSESSISRLEGNKIVPVAALEDGEKPPAKPNDLVVDYLGRIWVTITPRNQVIRIDPDGTRTVVTDKVISPNGITISPDASQLYVAAYRPKEIISFHVSGDGSLSDEKVFAVMDDGEALGADGMSIDRAGNVYCAGATDIWIWSPKGELLDKIKTPERPINCTFGDRDFRTLYISTFGGLYSQRMNVSGVSPEPDQHSMNAEKNLLSTDIPESVAAYLNLPYTRESGRKMHMDLFVPEGEGPHPTVVVVHGGGWLKGDKIKFRPLAIDLAKRGFVAAAIEYRLGDEAAYPAAVIDCATAVRFLRTHADQYKVDSNRIAAIGGSAGGHLVGLLATGGDDPTLVGSTDWSGVSSRIQAAIVMAGPMLMASGSVAERSISDPDRSNSNRWLRKSFAEDPELYRHSDAELRITADDPPILFLVGELDKPERYLSTTAKLNEVHVPTETIIYPKAKHGCWMRPQWFSRMNDDMEAFMRKHLN
ncbi:SMP-30/gluconolactonase/LRE family protein [Calycomorphotria hydatis]|uniref:SMP-30/gluconolactonase/LRE family protein n=1 Tax=Calycomorphotria hydatis TaxID=2528027 RepID=UPI001E37B591|nr:SMP-30/gluconolactonase/LRE family protein [Calycomorphotria hydatis]